MAKDHQIHRSYNNSNKPYNNLTMTRKSFYRTFSKHHRTQKPSYTQVKSMALVTNTTALIDATMASSPTPGSRMGSRIGGYWAVGFASLIVILLSVILVCVDAHKKRNRADDWKVKNDKESIRRRLRERFGTARALRRDQRSCPTV